MPEELAATYPDLGQRVRTLFLNAEDIKASLHTLGLPILA